MEFSRQINSDIVIEYVNINRATMSEAEEFRDILLKDIDDGFLKIIIDLTNCHFMDSTFLGAIIIAFKRLSRLGGDLKIANAKSDTKSLLELTGTSRIFNMYDSQLEALESFM